MATHEELMTTGQAALESGFTGDYALDHKVNCIRVLSNSPVVACSCGLDQAWTIAVQQAAQMVFAFGVVQRDESVV